MTYIRQLMTIAYISLDPYFAMKKLAPRHFELSTNLCVALIKPHMPHNFERMSVERTYVQ